MSRTVLVLLAAALLACAGNGGNAGSAGNAPARLAPCGPGRAPCAPTGRDGGVPCRTDDDCGCTRHYDPAPAWLLGRGHGMPGDCIARCVRGSCTATQAPM